MSSPEIVLNGDQSLTLNLKSDEQDLLNEINLVSSAPRPTRPKPPPIDPSMDAFMNANKKSVRFTARPEDETDERQPEEFIEEEDMGPPEEEEAYYDEPKPSEGYSSIEDEKADLLNKLARLEKKGFKTASKLNAYSDIELMRTEYKRIMYQIETDQGVKFARRILIACVTGVEFLNKKFDPFDIELDGWSENMMENVEDYDSVFEELHAKYKNKVAVAPEIKLMMMVGGSAMMFHLTKSMFKGFDAANMMKQNPDLMKNMMDAMKNSVPQGPPPPPPTDGSRREMKGPGLDIGSLMSGFMPPPPPMNRPVSVREEETESVSDIVSTVSGDIKDVSISKPKRTSRKKKEVTI
jgi:Family of unknown function (DUF5767)